MKYCPKCRTEKAFNEFGSNKSKRDGLQAYCKSCRAGYMNTWYNNNLDLQRERSKTARHKAIIRAQDFILDYLEKHHCVDCDEDDPIVLQFDHVVGDKEFNVGRAVSLGYSILAIQKEIEKCVVRCANDHIRKTSKEFNYYKSRRIGDTEFTSVS
jgi:hypothetical protein